MKYFSMKRLLTITLLSTAILTALPVGANAEWRKGNGGWWYTEGNSYVKGWRNIDNKRYYFYSNGYMAKDTVIGGYYLNSHGEIEKDIDKVINDESILNKNSIIMGIWNSASRAIYYHKFDSKDEQYLRDLCAKLTKVNFDDLYNHKVKLVASDSTDEVTPQFGWFQNTLPNGAKIWLYCRDLNEGWIRNDWAEIDGKWYYFDEFGTAVHGPQREPINGVYYVFNNDCSLKSPM